MYKYLDFLGAKTVVIEFDYVDGDYLEDFASYYVRCFESYDRYCKRLHFFAAEVDDDWLLDAILKEPSHSRAEKLNDAYLGFVVVRPLPQAVIGRTVLATYPKDKKGATRHYKSVLNYEANLFGIDLDIESLAFQEQDTVLAACATVSLWTAFHKTAELFQTPRPRPAVITRVANQVVRTSRPVPSDGLTVRQMSHAIREVDLEPEIFRVTPALPVSSLIYGYLALGLPVIAVIDIAGRGTHAVTITGYSLQDSKQAVTQEVAGNSRSVPSVALRIDEFYGHDDQIGPFSRLHVNPASGNQPVSFEGEWEDSESGDTLKLTPRSIVVPVYDKIRITYVEVQRWLFRFTQVVALVIPDDADDSLEWDVRLTTTNQFKRSIKSEGLGHTDVGRSLLLRPHPKYIWRCTLRYHEKKLVEFLIDATDMARSFQIYFAIWRHEPVARRLSEYLQSDALKQLLKKVLTDTFFDFLTQNLPESEQSTEENEASPDETSLGDESNPPK